jgi:outer membrane protein OmpA-like peptidoglycan-associated protein
MGDIDTTNTTQQETDETPVETLTERYVTEERPHRSLWLGGLGLFLLFALAPVYAAQQGKIRQPSLFNPPLSAQKSLPPTLPPTLTTPAPTASPSPNSHVAPVVLQTPTPEPAATPEPKGPLLSLDEAQTALRRAVPGLVLTFPLHSSDLGVPQKRALERVAGILKHSPVTAVELGGYAEEEQDEKKRVQLSASRMSISLVYLVSQGTPPEQIIGVGYGKRSVSTKAPASGIEIRVNAKD